MKELAFGAKFDASRLHITKLKRFNSYFSNVGGSAYSIYYNHLQFESMEARWYASNTLALRIPYPNELASTR